MRGVDSSRSSSHNHRKNPSEVRLHQKKNKSKKRRPRDATLSDSDDDRKNNASKPVSSPDSKDDHIRIRKKIRKKVRCSSSREDRTSLRRKRKTESEAVKKSKKRGGNRKRSRRDVNVSSLSSDSSRSCSTCQDGGSGDGNSEGERLRRRDYVSSRAKSSTRSRSDRGRQMSRSSAKTRNEKHKRRYRSRSCSSCSGCSSRSHQSEERWIEGNNSKRRRMEGVGRRNKIKDDTKAEIIQAYDDCPSSRSNDSHDGGRKGESGMVISPNHLHVTEKKARMEMGGILSVNASNVNEKGNVNGKETFSPKIMTQLIDDERGIGGQFSHERSEIPVDVGNSEVDDLESLLRQKALENLRKFRGGLFPNAKPVGGQKDESRIFKQSTGKGESIQIESHEEAGGEVRAIEVTQNTKLLSISAERIANPLSDAVISTPTRRISRSKLTDKINGYGGKNKAMQGTLTCRPDSLGDCSAVIGNGISGVNRVKPEQVMNGATDNENKDIVKQVSALQESSNKMFLEQTSDTKNIPDKRVPETSNAVLGSSDLHGSEANNADSSVAKASSSVIPYTKDHDSNEPKDGAKGGSQFEQKTMSVMRGGERVQVSYKVYIPKKTPALSRRHLQR